MLVHSKNLCIFALEMKQGALAHLARALDWQSKGDEFESRMLHGNIGYVKVLSLLYSLFKFYYYICAIIIPL